MFNKDVYVNRREKLKSIIKEGVIILPGNQQSPRNYRGNDYHFEQDSNFLYYFGIDIPNLMGIIDVDNNKEYIFGKDYTLDDIVWSGEQKLLKEFAHDSGVDNFIELSELESFANQLLKEERKLLFLPQCRADLVLQLSKLFGLNPFDFSKHTSEKLIKAIVSQRNIKSQLEIDEIENYIQQFLKASNLTSNDIDAVVLGNDGDVEYDKYYNFANVIFGSTSQVYYKHLSGEYNTASSFGFWIAANILKLQQIPTAIQMNAVEKSSYKYVLLYNQYQGKDHSLILLKKC